MYKKSSTKHKTSTVQNVMVGVALVSSIGAFAAGFAALPSRQENEQQKFSNGRIEDVQKKSPDTLKNIGSASQLEALTPGKFYRSGPESIFYFSLDKKLYKFSSLRVWNSWNIDSANVRNFPQNFSNYSMFVEPKLIGFRPGSRIVYLKKDLIKYPGKETQNYNVLGDELQVLQPYIWDTDGNLLPILTSRFPVSGVRYDLCEGMSPSPNFCTDLYGNDSKKHYYTTNFPTIEDLRKYSYTNNVSPTHPAHILSPGEFGYKSIVTTAGPNYFAESKSYAVENKFKDIETYISVLGKNSIISE